MSLITENAAPDTPYSVFPDGIDTITRKVDVDALTKSLVDLYHQYVDDGNFTAAADLLNSNPSLQQTIWRAEDYNRVRDGLIAVERTFVNDIENYIAHVVKNKGTWSDTVQYHKYDVVLYCTNPTVQTINAYMANPSQEDVMDVPIGTLPTNTEWWVQVSIRGEKGDPGTNFNIKDEYDTLNHLREDYPTGNYNAYMVADQNHDIYIWSELQNDWINIGHLQTPLNIFTFVTELPDSGDTSTLYVVPKMFQGHTVYNTYGWINNEWKYLGGVDTNASIVYQHEFVLQTNNWQEINDDIYHYQYNYELANINDLTKVEGIFDPESMKIAIEAEMYPIIESISNTVIFKSTSIPTNNLYGIFTITQGMNRDPIPVKNTVIYDDTTGLGYYSGINNGSFYIEQI